MSAAEVVLAIIAVIALLYLVLAAALRNPDLERKLKEANLQVRDYRQLISKMRGELEPKADIDPVAALVIADINEMEGRWETKELSRRAKE